MSTSSETADLAPKVDPLDVLKAWERGDLDCRVVTEKEPEALNLSQRKRLWALLNSTANPGTIASQLPR